MRILIGDSRLNQIFLTVAARQAGFTDITGAATAHDVLEHAAAANVIVFDPNLGRGEYAVDVTMELVRLVPQTPMIVVSSRTAELDRAELNGLAAVRKLSVLQLDPLAIAMAVARDLAASRHLAGAA